MTLSLSRRAHPLATPEAQRKRLAALGPTFRFSQRLEQAGLPALEARAVDTLQINVGKLCNQTCAHCHVDAGPDRTEVMPDDVVDACLALLIEGDIPTLDITGGAPELHPRFRDIVRTATGAGRRVLHRCNLTVMETPSHRDLPELLADLGVEIVASLPHYAAEATDRQRGDGIFERSIRALRRLNELGYGMPGSDLVLDLVTNPVGAFLPGAQASLERTWHRELERRHRVRFRSLYAITNMPISRFLEFLDASDNLEAYMHKLLAAFNPAAVEGVMCRDLVSVAWDGGLYDCDFNQMLEIPASIGDGRLDVRDHEPGALVASLARRGIRTAPHCLGCTAGAGSSCSGATA